MRTQQAEATIHHGNAASTPTRAQLRVTNLGPALALIVGLTFSIGAWVAAQRGHSATLLLVTGCLLTVLLSGIMLAYRRAAQQREADSERLAKTLDNRQAEIQRLMKELKSRNEALSEFSRVVAHDLRAPARQIANFAEFLSEEVSDTLNPEQLEWMRFLSSAGRKMQTIVDELMTFTRIDTTASNTGTVDLNSVITIVVNDVSRANSDVEFDVQKLPVVSANPELILTLFQHLVENAAKFRDENPQRVSVTATINDRGQHEIWVSDTGIGIAPENRERVFGVFSRLHHQNRYSGAGIGLASCRKVVEHLGGHLWVEPNQPRGSIFKFTLPLHKSSGQANAA